MAFSIPGEITGRPVALREKVAFSEERLLAALHTLRQEARGPRRWSSIHVQSEQRCTGRERDRSGAVRSGSNGTTAIISTPPVCTFTGTAGRGTTPISVARGLDSMVSARRRF